MLGGVAIFTIGVMIGMKLFGVAVSYPVVRYGMREVQVAIDIIAGSLSIIYGIMMVMGLGFNPFDLVLR